MAVNCTHFERTRRRLVGLGTALATTLAIVVSPVTASAEEPRPAGARGPELSAALEVATLVLPTAGLLDANKLPTTGVDVALPLGFHFLYRVDRVAIGATASLALLALTSSAYSGTAELPRTHERGFFQLGPELRYFLHEGAGFEASLGAKLGLVMLADRYANVPGDRVPSNYGVKTVSVRSEGLVAMVGGGGAWRFGRIFAFGVDLRGGLLAFPGGAKCLPGGDCASMEGVFPAFELGVSFAIVRAL